MDGGEEQKDQNYEAIGILKQLTSPPKSALAFRDYLIRQDADQRLSVPLGTIDLLVSPSPEDPEPGEAAESFERATLGNIMSAYSRWRTLCDNNAQNIALFFFSGHGVEKDDHYLLAEDFGMNPMNPWMGSFAFDMTRKAFHGCQCETQIFLVDSCREVTPSMLTRDITAVPLETPNYLDSECKHDLTMKASARNEKALGKKRQPSYFTQAIIKALDGDAASRDGSQWVVKTSDIGAHINQIMKSVKSSEGYSQRCTYSSGESKVILQYDEAPTVTLEVACESDHATAMAEFQCKEINGQFDRVRSPARPSPWKLPVKAGFYSLSATFNDPDYEDVNEQFSFVQPPYTFERLSR